MKRQAIQAAFTLQVRMLRNLRSIDHRTNLPPRASRAGSVLESSSLASTVEVGGAHDSVHLASSESEETLAPFLDTPVSSPRPHQAQQETVSTPCPPNQHAPGSAPSRTSLALEGLLTRSSTLTSSRYEDSPLGRQGRRVSATSAVVQTVSRGNIVHTHRAPEVR